MSVSWSSAEMRRGDDAGEWRREACSIKSGSASRKLPVQKWERQDAKMTYQVAAVAARRLQEESVTGALFFGN